MSNRLPQEEQERFYLDKFLEVMDIQPDRIERGDDPPDFYFCNSEIQIAVELTEFHTDDISPNGHPRRAVEAEWLIIQNLFDQERTNFPQLDKISILIFWKEIQVPSSSQHQQFLNELLTFTQKHLDELTSDSKEYHDCLESYPLLNHYLRLIILRIANCYCTLESNLSVASGGVTEDKIQSIILPKLEKPRPENIDQNWLLIIGGPNMSQFMGLTHVGIYNDFINLNAKLEQGPYEKVYIYQYMFDRVLLWTRADGWSLEKEGIFSIRSRKQE